MWVKDPAKDSTAAFVKASVVKFTEGRGYTVAMPNGEQKTVRAVDCAQANPEGMSAPDNCYLIHISESTILDNMKLRFAKKLIYTYTSNILIAVNPFEELTVYGQEKMVPYKGKPLGILEPHTYAMAEEAYKTLLKSGGSQSLVVSGESGAGKTETNKHLMNYIAWRSKPDKSEMGGRRESIGSDLATAILQANPVLEAFGNAKTSRNNNSSRFGKFVKLAMSEKGAVLGAVTVQYLLEKSRVPFQSKGERNYHVFYQVCVCVIGTHDQAERERHRSLLTAPLCPACCHVFFYQVVCGYPKPADLSLQNGCAAFHYLAQSGVATIPGVDDKAEYARLMIAMSHIGISTENQELVARLLAGLLHVGNAAFSGEDEAAIQSASTPSLDAASALMSVTGLGESLVSSTMTTRNETMKIHLTPAKAALARDALTKAVYARLFDWIVMQVRECTSSPPSPPCPPHLLTSISSSPPHLSSHLSSL